VPLGRLRFMAKLILVYSSALRRTLTFVGLMAALALLSAYLGGKNLHDIFELAQEIKAPEGLHEWIIWASFFSLKLAPLLGFVEVVGLDREERTVLRVRAMEGHVVVVGLGHLGQRIVRDLLACGREVVALVLPADRESNEAVEDVRREGARVVFGDATTKSALLRAGVDRASTVILTVDDDLTNATIAERVRKLNPRARIIVRVFRREIADLLEASGVASVTLSTSEISSDLFTMASDLEVVGTAPIPSPVRIAGDLAGRTPRDLEALGFSALARLRGGVWEALKPDQALSEGDVILVQRVKRAKIA